MKRFALVCTASALIVLASFPAEVRAQAPTITGGVRYTVFHQPGEATKEIVLMADQQSGIYVIGESIELDKFLALAGVSLFERETDRTEVEKTVRVLREQGGERVVVYEARTTDLLVQSNQYPTLQEEDIIAIETKVNRVLDFRTVLRVTSQLASLTLLALRLYDAFNR